MTDARLSFNKDVVTVLLLLDIEKAFDTVWTDGLIHKLITYGYSPILVKLIHSYLNNRHLKVIVNGKKSTRRKIKAGVPQDRS